MTIGAVTLAVLTAGGYWPRSQLAVGALIVAAAAVGAGSLTKGLTTRFATTVATAGMLCGYALIRAGALGRVGEATGLVALVVGVVLVFGIVAAAPIADRRTVLDAMLALGTFVAVTGTIGVAGHLEAFALHDPSSWRAMGTLSYPNAAAAVVVPLFLVALARLVRAPDDSLMVLAATLLLAGAAATMSRGGLLALLVGIVVLAVWLGARRTLRALLAPALGAVIVVATSSPSLGTASSPHLWLGIGGLLAGVGGAWLLSRTARTTTPAAGRALATVLVILVALGASTVAATRFGDVTDRVTPMSSDRVEALRAAWHEIQAHPVLGVGPGRSSLVWTRGDGESAAIRYVHNEYVQVLLELGVVGVVAFATLLVTFVHAIRRGRAYVEPREEWVGLIVGLVALAMHSAFDFLWHLPAIPLLAAVLAGAAAAPLQRGGNP